VFGFVRNVAWKFAEAEGELAAEVEEGADENEDAAEKEEQAADLARFHGLRDGGDAAEEVGLFGYGFGADGEGVEEI
jgi:hypothetical protein